MGVLLVRPGECHRILRFLVSLFASASSPRIQRFKASKNECHDKIYQYSQYVKVKKIQLIAKSSPSSRGEDNVHSGKRIQHEESHIQACRISRKPSFLCFVRHFASGDVLDPIQPAFCVGSGDGCKNFRCCLLWNSPGADQRPRPRKLEGGMCVKTIGYPGIGEWESRDVGAGSIICFEGIGGIPEREVRYPKREMVLRGDLFFIISLVDLTSLSMFSR
jgi:hypothetical protein